jgi:hypothetical protein
MVEILAVSRLSYGGYHYRGCRITVDNTPVETRAREKCLNLLNSLTVRTCFMATCITCGLVIINLRAITAFTLNRQ